MGDLTDRNRRPLRIEDEFLRVTVTAEGANVAEITHKTSGVNPLWTPPWPPIEPSQWSAASHPEYGADAEARVLASITGHSLCLDTYGAPSAEESAAGIPIHGEGFTVPYDCQVANEEINMEGRLPLSQVIFRRGLRLGGNGGVGVVHFRESVENLCSFDRPIAWTQHVTLGPPFVDGNISLRAPVRESKVIDADFGGDQLRAAEFEWPLCPAKSGGRLDLRTFPVRAPSGGFTSHRVDPANENGYLVAWNPACNLAFGYAWRRADFPWLCRWEENRLRAGPPWNGRTVALGLEFGVSPYVGSRREMVTRGSLFGEPCFRWLPARSRIEVTYCAFAGTADAVPETIEWDGGDTVCFG